jgi:hypothetical protein
MPWIFFFIYLSGNGLLVKFKVDSAIPMIYETCISASMARSLATIVYNTIVARGFAKEAPIC